MDYAYVHATAIGATSLSTEMHVSSAAPNCSLLLASRLAITSCQPRLTSIYINLYTCTCIYMHGVIYLLAASIYIHMSLDSALSVYYIYIDKVV